MPMNPHNDTLSASWLGGQNNPKPSPKADGVKVKPEEIEHYTTKDENWYRVQAIYGEQEELPRSRRGRRHEPDDAA